MKENNNVTSNAPTSISAVSSQQGGQRPFLADRIDGIFAIFVFVLGYIFAHWVLFSWQGWGVTVFTFLYCGSICIYFLKKGISIPPVGWFWLTIVILTGLSYSLWSNNSLVPWRSLLLFCSAVYWIICATGLPILGKTSNWLILDGLNALIVIPFNNFGIQYRSLAMLRRGKEGKGGQILSIVLGLLLMFIVGALVLPLLMEADSGGFAKITNGIISYFEGIGNRIAEPFFHGILAIPIAAYIFGLVAGSAHKRASNLISEEGTRTGIVGLRVLPIATIFTLLGLLCLLYIVFIGSQLPCFFSAFIGRRPEGWLIYSEYARRGFFELCGIAAINLSVLTGVNILSKKTCRDSLLLKILNSVLALLTIVLIATAFSKMAMYIGAYGLSVQRLLPSIFMLFLAIICGGIIALQKWQFSIGRLALGVGVIMLCTLCLLDPDRIVARYNAERYLAGTLSNFDVEILYRSGPAGVAPALEVYGKTDDQALRSELQEYLGTQQEISRAAYGQAEDNLQKARARKMTDEFAELSSDS